MSARMELTRSCRGLQGSIGNLGQKIPSDALLFGAAGLLPYAGTSLGSIYLARQAGIANALGGEFSVPS